MPSTAADSATPKRDGSIPHCSDKAGTANAMTWMSYPSTNMTRAQEIATNHCTQDMARSSMRREISLGSRIAGTAVELTR
jgi:hypothetical protein